MMEEIRAADKTPVKRSNIRRDLVNGGLWY